MKTNFLAKVPSSPSEPDPMMWADGLATLGDYMAAKERPQGLERFRRLGLCHISKKIVTRELFTV